MGRERKEQVLNAAIAVCKRQDFQFTMDDIARELSMSKKTIYGIFSSKDELLLELVDFYFDKIKQAERKVMEDTTKNTKEKLQGILFVLPESYRDIDFRKLYLLSEKYPKVYSRICTRLESNWEDTLYLMRRGIEEGVFRRFSLQLFKMMAETSLEQFVQRTFLLDYDLDYQEALDEMAEILVEGIITR